MKKEYKVIEELDKQSYLGYRPIETGWSIDQVIPVKREIVEFRYVLVREVCHEEKD